MVTAYMKEGTLPVGAATISRTMITTVKMRKLTAEKQVQVKTSGGAGMILSRALAKIVKGIADTSVLMIMIKAVAIEILK